MPVPAIAIVTDTNASLPLELIQNFSIFQVPQSVNFSSESYEAVYQIDDAALFKRVDRENVCKPLPHPIESKSPPVKLVRGALL
jgi:fatty acid-binding protein DegV